MPSPANADNRPMEQGSDSDRGSDRGEEAALFPWVLSRTRRQNIVEMPKQSDPWEPVPFTEGIPEKQLRVRKPILYTYGRLMRARNAAQKKVINGDVLVELMDLPQVEPNSIRQPSEELLDLFQDEVQKKKELMKRLGQEEEVDEDDLPDEVVNVPDGEGFIGFPCPEAEEAPFPNVENGYVPDNGSCDADVYDDEPRIQSSVSGGEDCSVEDDVLSSSYERLVEMRIKQYVAQANNALQSSEMAARVAKWHDTIRPRLEEVEARSNFSVHDYGTRVIDKFPREKSGKNEKITLPFADIVRGCDGPEVARYFLATLQLANSYNIEISKSDPSPLSMDCVEVTLLSVHRHHKQLEEYQAPSQEARMQNQESRAGPSGENTRKRKRPRPQSLAERSSEESDDS